jgi:hypothetical protein
MAARLELAGLIAARLTLAAGLELAAGLTLAAGLELAGLGARPESSKQSWALLL